MLTRRQLLASAVTAGAGFLAKIFSKHGSGVIYLTHRASRGLPFTPLFPAHAIERCTIAVTVVQPVRYTFPAASAVPAETLVVVPEPKMS